MNKKGRVGILWKTIVRRPSSQVMIKPYAVESSINNISWVLSLKVIDDHSGKSIHGVGKDGAEGRSPHSRVKNECEMLPLLTLSIRQVLSSLLYNETPSRYLAILHSV